MRARRVQVVIGFARDSFVVGRIAIAAALLFATATASAQDDAERARQLFELGVASMESGDPANAARYFEQSYQTFPRASTACNMAIAQERMARACDAQRWYQQCAALDRSGRFRDHANRQAAALGAQCAAAPPPPIMQPAQPQYAPPAGQLQIVETSAPPPPTSGPDHTLLGVGIAGLVLGAGALTGAILAGEAAWDEYDQISVPSGGLAEGSEDAEHYEQAALLSDVAVGLYVGAAVLGGLGAVFLVVDLSQPGVFGDAAVAIGPGHASLRLRF